MPETVLLAGGSGLIGQCLLRGLLAAGCRVLLPLRDPSGWCQQHPELAADPAVRTLSYNELWQCREAINAYFCALGTTRAEAGREGLLAVDYQLVIDCASHARQRGAVLASVVSAAGADARSPIFYNRVKGQMENSLSALHFDRTHLWRPSVLLGDRPRSRPLEQLAGWFLRSPLWGNAQALPGEVVARAMLNAALHQRQSGVLHLPVAAIRYYAGQS